MKTHSVHSFGHAPRGRGFLIVLLASAAAAHGAEAARTETAEKSETARGGETVVMSPFEVKTDGDVGYIATTSLAGSRLNSAL